MSGGVCVCLSFDFDAMSSWIATGTRSPNAISRGEFGRVGALRLLDLLRARGLRSTWFVPGHTIEAFPAVIERILADGHEIGHHGYCHENPAPLEKDAEREILERGIELVERASESAPRGYRSPYGSFSANTLELLLERGFVYDSSMMADDFSPYYCRTGDQFAPDRPYVFGRTIDLVEVPFAWHLDDHPFFEHVVTRRGINPGLAAPSHVLEVWQGEFDYLYDRLGAGVFTLTMHPQVIGRGHRMLMLERLLEHIERRRGVRFATLLEYVVDWKRENPFDASSPGTAEPSGR
jgi:peptidoglycan/xylan/chitin deacetylase (PgdA/CDA1 family)